MSLSKSEENLDVEVVSPADGKEFRRALWKLDLIFLPVVTLVYFLNFLDVRGDWLPDRSAPTLATPKPRACSRTST